MSFRLVTYIVILVYTRWTNLPVVDISLAEIRLWNLVLLSSRYNGNCNTIIQKYINYRHLCSVLETKLVLLWKLCNKAFHLLTSNNVGCGIWKVLHTFMVHCFPSIWKYYIYDLNVKINMLSTTEMECNVDIPPVSFKSDSKAFVFFQFPHLNLFSFTVL